MAETAIIYASVHHGNTKKLAEGIAQNVYVDIFDVKDASKKDFSSYRAVGLASGIYMSQMHKSLFAFLESAAALPKKTFVIYTSGSGGEKYANNFCDRLKQKGMEVCGVYQCKGYDTFGPFKLIGGIAKGRPDEADISAASLFVKKITRE